MRIKQARNPHDDLERNRYILHKCNNLVDVLQKQYQLGRDDSDIQYINMRKAIKEMEGCLTTYENLTDFDRSTDDFADEDEHVQKFWDSLLSLGTRFSRRKEKKVLSEAKVYLRDAYTNLNQEFDNLTMASTRRFYGTKLGSFFSLIEVRTLVTESGGFYLVGRYQETGNELYAVGLELSKTSSLLNREMLNQKQRILRILYESLAQACVTLIGFMVDIPFDISAFEHVIEEMKRLVRAISSHAEKPSSRAIFQIQSRKKRPNPFYCWEEISASPFADEEPREAEMTASTSLRKVNEDLDATAPMEEHKHLMNEINAITEFLSHRRTKYKERKAKFEENTKTSCKPAGDRALPKHGFKRGDLKSTSIVINQIKQPREKLGLGLPIIASGLSTPTVHTRNGGYGIVSGARLPEEAIGLDYLKATGRLVAVKTASANQGGPDAIALANLRLLREAHKWTLVSSDPRNLQGGGKYLARVLGIWVNFVEGRPGLVSLWGPEDLKGHICRLPGLAVSGKMVLARKVALGVDFLHTCNPAIVHGDLKAANVIMIDGEPRLTDFGIAKCLDNRGPECTTRSDSYSEGFRAPEIVHRERSLLEYPTKKTDVYAFGCVLFEVLTGYLPHAGVDSKTKKEWYERNEDHTPLDVLEDNGTKFEIESCHKFLMKKCFNFHASRRPTMRQVVDFLSVDANSPRAMPS